MNINPAWEGALRSLGIVLLMSLLSWVANQANLAPLFGVGAAGIITMLAGSLENFIKSQTGAGLFGAARPR